MSLSNEKEFMDKLLKAPNPPNPKPHKKISFINIIEADDDSDSESNQNNNIFVKNKIKVSDKKNSNSFDDDRYEDSYDEEFGESETYPDSVKCKYFKKKIF